ncbi:MAG: hypothetical protein P8Y13_05945 [Deinococcales bacterium]
MATLSDRLSRAELTVQREAQQAGQREVDAAISVGTALPDSFLGRRGVAASRVSTALKSVNRIPKEAADAQRARETAERIRTQLADLQAELERALAELELPGADALELGPVRVLARSTGIATRYVGLLWIPFRRHDEGRWKAATSLPSGAPELRCEPIAHSAREKPNGCDEAVQEAGPVGQEPATHRRVARRQPVEPPRVDEFAASAGRDKSTFPSPRPSRDGRDRALRRSSADDG